jgi:hypothetical protein
MKLWTVVNVQGEVDVTSIAFWCFEGKSLCRTTDLRNSILVPNYEASPVTWASSNLHNTSERNVSWDEARIHQRIIFNKENVSHS